MAQRPLRADQQGHASAWQEAMDAAHSVGRKIKAGIDYVNKNVNPLTADSTKKAGSDYMQRAKTQSAAGRATNVDARMSRLEKDYDN